MGCGVCCDTPLPRLPPLQALAIFFGITSFTLFLSVTIYAGEVNKAGAFNPVTNPNGKLPGGKWGPGFGLTVFGAWCPPPPSPELIVVSCAAVVAGPWLLLPPALL